MTPDARIRTMSADMASPASSGGDAPSELITFPKDSAPTQPIPMELPPGQSSSAVKALRWLIALIAIIALGWAAYNYGWPALRAMNEPATEPATVEPAPAPQEPAALVPEPALPAAGIFNTPPITVTADLTPSGIIAALAAQAKLDGSEAPTAWNFAINGPSGPVSFPDLLTALIPEAGPSGLAEFFRTGFDPAFTSFVFHDDKGSWPGYIVKVADGGPDIVTLADRLQKLESVSYQNFFLSSPGAAQAFRTGQVKEQYMNRFAAFSTPGASFNYGIFGQYVIINTSYGGLLKALELLAI